MIINIDNYWRVRRVESGWIVEHSPDPEPCSKHEKKSWRPETVFETLEPALQWVIGLERDLDHIDFMLEELLALAEAPDLVEVSVDKVSRVMRVENLEAD